MGKLLKYEIRKNRVTTIVILIGLAILELWFVISTMRADTETSTMIGSIMSAILLVIYTIVCFFMVFILSVRSYANELNTKTGFMLFMVPRTPTSVILAKLLYTLIFGTVLAGLLVACAAGDWTLLISKFGTIEDVIELAKSFFDMFRLNPGRYLVQALGYILNFLISFFSAVVIAYFAVTLAATWLQSSRFRGIISFLLFLVIIVILRTIESHLPEIGGTVKDAETLLIHTIPSMVFNLVVMVAGIWGSVWLLERKVSL